MGRQIELAKLVSSLHTQVRISEVEVVVVDSSPQRSSDLQYLLNELNGVYHWTGVANGVDSDFDLSVQLSHGTYCWLLPDDDEIVPGAISRILEATELSPELILVNAAVYDLDMARLLRDSMITTKAPVTIFGPVSSSDLQPYVGLLTYIGSVVIGREVWKRALSKSYFGSEFVHVGVIGSQLPLAGLRVITEPQVHIRYGQGYWEERFVKVWWNNWESLILEIFDNSYDQEIWHVFTGWRRVRDAAFAKALFFAKNSDIRMRLSGQPNGGLAKWIVKWGIILCPSICINYLLSALFILRKPRSLEIYDLKRRRVRSS
jgi:hypothetical protein